MTTAVFLTGFEYGLVPGGSGLGTFAGASAVTTGASLFGGSYGYNFHSAAPGGTFTTPAFASTQTVVGRLYIRQNAKSTPNNHLAYIMMNTGGTRPLIAFNTTTNKYELGISVGGSKVEFGTAIANGEIHYIDFSFVCNGTTWTLKASLDGQNEATYSPTGMAALNMTVGLFGSAVSGDAFDYDLDNIVLSATGADYPIGEGFVRKLSPAFDGTHNAGVNVMEDSAGNDIGAVTAWNLLDDVPLNAGGVTDRVQQTATGTGNYIEVGFETQIGEVIQGVWGELDYASASTLANTAACIVRRSDATEISIKGTAAAPVAWNVTGDNYASALITAPGGGWTITEVNALRMRFGYSSDANPDPYILSFMLEVAVENDTPLPVIQAPPLDETFDLEHDYLGWQEWLTDETVVVEEPQGEIEYGIIDETYYEDHDYQGVQYFPTPDDVVIVEDRMVEALPEAAEDTYDPSEFDFSGWTSNFIESALEPDLLGDLENGIIDETYYEDHDYQGLQFNIDEEGNEDFQLLSEIPEIDESYDEVHDYQGFQWFPTPDDVLPEADLFAPQLPVIDETFDEDHDYQGEQWFDAGPDNADFQLLSEVPEIDETYEETHDYQGLQFAILEPGNEDFQRLSEIPVVDETYDLEHDYQGVQFAIIEAGNEDFQDISEIPVIDEHYDVEYDYSGLQFSIAEPGNEDFQRLSEIPQIDETYDEVHDYQGLQWFPTPADVLPPADYLFPYWPQIDETYEEIDPNLYNGLVWFPTPADVVPDIDLHIHARNKMLTVEHPSGTLTIPAKGRILTVDHPGLTLTVPSRSGSLVVIHPRKRK